MMKVIQICKYRNNTVEGVDLFEEVLRSAQGHARSFYILNGDAGDLEQRLGCETRAFQLHKKDIKRIRVSAVRKVFHALRDDKPDVIITHRFKPAVFAAWSCLLLGRKKARAIRKIAVIHNMAEFQKPRRLWFARLMMRDWIFVGCSNAVRDDMLARGFPPERTAAVPNSVDERIVRDNLLSREQARRELGIPLDAHRVIGNVGRMRPVKGHRYFLEAMAGMDNPPHVAVIGDGELLEEMRQASREQGLEEKLIFAGGRRNAYRYLAAFDAIVMPSLREGLPIAILEAIAAGVPAFATPVGGVAEVLDNPDWRFPKEDAAAVKAVLERLANASDEELAEIRDAQYRVLSERFSIDIYHQRFRALIDGA